MNVPIYLRVTSDSHDTSVNQKSFRQGRMSWVGINQSYDYIALALNHPFFYRNKNI
jgi:hypothetical protein